MADIETVLEQCTPPLLQLEGVLGVGQGEAGGAPVVVVLVRAMTPRLRQQLPAHLDGFPVQVQEVGDIQGAAG